MEKLKTFLKSLPDDAAREAFAKRCGTTLGHMRNTIYEDGKFLSVPVCVAVERESGRKVRRWDLRPNDWPSLWPELTSRRNAPEVSAQ